MPFKYIPPTPPVILVVELPKAKDPSLLTLPPAPAVMVVELVVGGVAPTLKLPAKVPLAPVKSPLNIALPLASTANVVWLDFLPTIPVLPK